MAKSQETYNKKEQEKKRLKKRLDKAAKKAERKASPKVSGFEDMIAYVDENGHLTDTPPDLSKRKKINAKNIEIGVPKRTEEEVITTRTGIVEFFNDAKGFGFIKEQGSGEKFFVHINGVVDEIAENDKVTFELEQGLKGINAVKVIKI